jgi:hypothetical protein
MLPAVRSVTVRGLRWKIGKIRDKGERGACEAPSVPGREMDIPVHGGTRNDLDTLCHELLHAAYWDLDEEAVYETATDIAKVLWRCGWRKQMECRA